MTDGTGQDEASAPIARRSAWGRAGAARALLAQRRSKLLLAALLVIVVLLGLDRIALVVAQRRLADRIRAAEHLDVRPDVTIAGWPFLSQVIGGSYRNVTISIPRSATVDGVRITHPVVHLRKVQVGLSDMLHGTVSHVPVGSGTGDGVLRYADLNAALRRFAPTLGSAVTVSAAGAHNARLSGPFGLSLTITAAVHAGALLITPSTAELAQLPSIIRGPVDDVVHQPVPLPPFPFGVHLSSASFAADGVHLHATAHNSVFPVR